MLDVNVLDAMRSLLGGALDQAFDRAVVPGYSSVGYRLRQFGWAGDPAPDSLSGRTALVTGANRGIGKAIAAGLAGLGATVLLTVRDKESGERPSRRSRRQIARPIFRSRFAMSRIWLPSAPSQQT